MKILLIAIGSRGDVEPFLSAGELLKQEGHKVEFCFPEQFRSLALDIDCPFHSLGSEFLDLILGEDGKIVIGGHKSPWKRIKAFTSITKQSMKIQKLLAKRQKEIINKGNYDKVIFHIKAIYPTIWNLQTGGKIQLLSPVPCIHYVETKNPTSFGPALPKTINKLFFFFTGIGICAFIKKASKWIKVKPKLSFSQIRKAFFQTPCVYTVSPSLFEKPQAWDLHLSVLGFHERNRKVNWTPSQELKTFVKTHPKLLFISFGSMVNQAPEERTNMFLNILQKHNIPAIINTAGGALVKPKNFNEDLFFFTDTIPYEWILPKVYGMIHHGGAGTTHSSLKHGCATLILPHIVDQFIWNNVVKNNGAGPKGISSSKLTLQKLEPLIIDLYTNPTYKNRAEEIAHSMNNENFQAKLVESLAT